MATRMIFVEVFEEGSPVFQGLESEHVGENLNRLGYPPYPYDEDDLVLRFKPGAVVRCEPQELAHGIEMVAVEEIA